MLRILPVLMALLPAAALAQGEQAVPADSAEWRSEFAGISLPHTIGAFEFVETQEFAADGSDTALQYRLSNDPNELVTIYVYRSSYPNPALWLPRSMEAIEMRFGAGNIHPLPPVSFSTGVTAEDNALAQAFEQDTEGYTAGGVAMAQFGEWIVKVRVSSATFEPSQLITKMRALLAGVEFDGPAFSPHPLARPAPCDDRIEYTGAFRMLEGAERGPLVGEGLVPYSHARGYEGLAADPASYCRQTVPSLATLVDLYRPVSGDNQSGWTMLFGESGIAVSSYPLESFENGEHGLYVHRSTGSYAAGLADGSPSPESSVGIAIPIMERQSEGFGHIVARPGNGE